MNKSDLINHISERNTDISPSDIKVAIDLMLELIIKTLEKQHKVEIRGFGTFTKKTRKAGKARNPKSGESVLVEERSYIAFKPSRDLNGSIKR